MSSDKRLWYFPNYFIATAKESQITTQLSPPTVGYGLRGNPR